MKYPLTKICRQVVKLFIYSTLVFLAGLNANAAPPTLSLPQLLQQTLLHYPTVESMALQVKKAQQATILTESQLGWQFGARFGANKDFSVFAIPVTRLNAATELTRRLESGDTLAITANVSHEDNDTALFNLPNPAVYSNIDLNYRKPLAQGKGHTEYDNALTQARSHLKIQQARQQQAYDQIAAQLIDLYAATLRTQQRINNINQSISRSQRLQRFIKNRVNLGIAEDKDRLQTKAQLNDLQAQKEALNQARIKQSIALNRLMGKPWQMPVTLKTATVDAFTLPLSTLRKQAHQHSPALKINAALLTVANSLIKRQRDMNRDQFDMLFSLGNRGLSGDTTNGSINENEMVAGIQFEYSKTLDNSGNRAALYQAQLEHSITRQNKRQLATDIDYDIASLRAVLKSIQTTIKAYQRSVRSEQAKQAEADQRYRQGRITIDQIIRFENQTTGTELKLALQIIDYQRNLHHLNLLRGTLWDAIDFPHFNHVSINK